MNSIKFQKQTQNQRSAPETTATKEIPAVPANAKPTKKRITTNLRQKIWAQISASSPANDLNRNSQNEVTCSNRRQETTVLNLPKIELGKRRIIFGQELFLSLKSQEDLMLALMKSVQKAGISAFIRF